MSNVHIKSEEKKSNDNINWTDDSALFVSLHSVFIFKHAQTVEFSSDNNLSMETRFNEGIMVF